MRKVFFCILAITLATLSGCKKHDWMDWKLQNELYLAAMEDSITLNGVKFPLETTASGLKYAIIADPNPTDARPMTNNTIVCTYQGKLINGAVFDENKTGASFSVAGVVEGFAEGIKKIHNNGRIVLYIPYNLGYKANGAGAEGGSSFIPPYSTLIFDITLCGVF